MEEADLLKERLQAITDKRRIQEDIVKKRRQIEEEKLKLQYIKKKALREQWLMDGLSQQSEQEQENMRLQAQDEQQQSHLLQSNILRIEEEIQLLEDQELNISANEEVILKRLKEVERTADDIIKELNAGFNKDVRHHGDPPISDSPLFLPLTPSPSPPSCLPGSEEPKRATFAMEINVELDNRTGKSQVVSTASITPEVAQERGLKVFDDGRKSVYALHLDGSQADVVGEMTSVEVEELLRQATDQKVPMDVLYHQPVYSTAYVGSSRPSTPRTPNKAQRNDPVQNAESPMVGTHVPPEEPQGRRSPNLSQTEMPYFHIPGQFNNVPPSLDIGAKTPGVSLVSVKAKCEGMPAPIQPVYRNVDGHSPSLSSLRSDAECQSSVEDGPLNASTNLPDESSPVTMIFMGYENAEEEEEEEDVQAELIVIPHSDEDDDGNDFWSDGEESVSYHPQGHTSRVFLPRVGGSRNIMDDIYWDHQELHKPTFVHKPGGKHLQGTAAAQGSADSGATSLEEMKLCSTGR